MSDHWFHGGAYQWQHWCDIHSVRGSKLGPTEDVMVAFFSAGEWDVILCLRVLTSQLLFD